MILIDLEEKNEKRRFNLNPNLLTIPPRKNTFISLKVRFSIKLKLPKLRPVDFQTCVVVVVVVEHCCLLHSSESWFGPGQGEVNNPSLFINQLFEAIS